MPAGGRGEPRRVHGARARSVPQRAADYHHSRGLPHQGVPHERSRAAGARGTRRRAPMTPVARLRAVVLGATLVALVVTRQVHAQFIVYDPTNYLEAVAHVEQLLR